MCPFDLWTAAATGREDQDIVIPPLRISTGASVGRGANVGGIKAIKVILGGTLAKIGLRLKLLSHPYAACETDHINVTSNLIGSTVESDFLIFLAAWDANLTCSDPVTALLRKPPSVFVYQLCLPFNPPPLPPQSCVYSRRRLKMMSTAAPR